MVFTNHMKIMIVVHIKKIKCLWINQFISDFSVLKLSKILMYETYYDELQPFFGLENLQLLHMDTDSFVLSVKTKDLRFYQRLKKS